MAPVLAGLGATAAAWAVGVDAGHVATVGLAAAAVTAVVGLLPLPAGLDWPEDEPPTHGQGWHQISLVAAYLRQTDLDPDRIGATLDRLRRLTSSRLVRAGVRWDDESARDLLGPELHDVLSGRRPPAPATQLTAEVLDRLDRVEGGARSSRGAA